MNKLLSNYLGVSLTVPSLVFNVENILFNSNVNLILTVVISILAITWWGMKIYDQYLITKNRKEEWKSSQK